MTMMDKDVLIGVLAAFFRDSLEEDAGDVAHWCEQSNVSPDEIYEAIKPILNEEGTE